jgi:hypothetical protein
MFLQLENQHKYFLSIPYSMYDANASILIVKTNIKCFLFESNGIYQSLSNGRLKPIPTFI